MTINQLKYFLSVCEFKKIRISSEQLHVSEPTISVSIKRLEEELGAPLFIRDRKQLILTEIGEELRAKASEVVESFDRLEREIYEFQQSRKETPVIHLAAPPTQGEHLCSQLVAAFMAYFPSVRFELPSASSADGMKRVAEEKIELAIGNQLAVSSNQLEFAPIIRNKLLGYVRKDHPLAGAENVTPEMLAQEKLILISEASMTSQQVVQWFRNAGVEPKIFMYSHRPNFTVSMLLQHNALAFFVHDPFTVSAHPHEDVASFTLDPQLSLTFGIVRKAGVKLSKEAQAFYNFCDHYYLDDREIT